MAHPPTTPTDAARSHAAEPVTSEPQAKPATHDTVPPPALLDFMMREWKPATHAAAPKIKSRGRLRRPPPRALASSFPARRCVIPTGHEKVRANDTYYRFRPGTDFYYLTGNLEPDCVLVLEPEAGGGHRDVLFVEPNPGRSDATFFTDRDQGRALGGPAPRRAARARRASASTRRAALPELPGVLARAAGPGDARRRACCAAAPAKVDGALPEQTERDKAARRRRSPRCGCSRTRRRSRELHAAIDSTQRGFEDVIRGLRTARRASARWRASSTCARASRATTSATAPSPPRARTPASCTGRSNDGHAAEGRRCSCSTPASRATRSTPRTSPARCPSPAGSSQGAAEIYELVHRGAGRRRSRR